MSEWIKCSDKMPELDTEVLAVDGWGDIGIGQFRDSRGAVYFSDLGDSLADPTHWQPLPAPPAKEIDNV